MNCNTETEGGREAELRTESRGGATKSCSTCAGPQDKRLRVRGAVSLFWFISLLFRRAQTQTLVALNHRLETGDREERHRVGTQTVLNPDFPAGICW